MTFLKSSLVLFFSHSPNGRKCSLAIDLLVNPVPVKHLKEWYGEGWGCVGGGGLRREAF